jgi:DNA topoisomerase I
LAKPQTTIGRLIAKSTLKAGPIIKAVDLDPKKVARQAGLRYVSDDQPGIRRERKGDEFVYYHPDGRLVADSEVLRRIRHLAIPPAYHDVWICPIENGHLQATGRDDRARKQYKYHERWREVRDENKYERLIAFAHALPSIRARVQADLAMPGLPRNKVLATIVELLETSLIRVGNEEYAKTNHSFGLTSMRNRHVRVQGPAIRFSFRGKGGKQHQIQIEDKRLARIVGRCQDLPGQHLFQYIGEEGEPTPIGSEDVNEYLQAICGQPFTAKDFRTWAGTVLAAIALHKMEAVDSKSVAKKNVVTAIEAVSKLLGNTPAICRKCYIHPDVINSYLNGGLARSLRFRADQEIAEKLPELKPEEAAVLAFLRQEMDARAKTEPR